jgi:hypothetical protein
MLYHHFFLTLLQNMPPIPGKPGGLKLSGTHQLLAYADDVNLLGDKKDIVRKTTESVIDVCKEVSTEVNAERTMYISLPHQNDGKKSLNKGINLCFT